MQQAVAHAGYQAAVRRYGQVALVLGLVTLVEFGIVYVRGFAMGVVGLLFLLSAGKFAVVALYFMHLKEDSRVYRIFFACGIVGAMIVAIGLTLLMQSGHVGMKM